MKNLMLMIGAVLLLPSCTMLNQKLRLQDDNLGEEVIEDVIEGRIGVDVDLTPSTPENK